MDMRVPFEWTSKSVKNTDEAGDVIFGFINLVEHTKNNTTNCIEQTVKKRTVFEKKVTELFVNGKNTVTVGTLN